MKVLVRTGGKKKWRARVHFYDAENDRALCPCYAGGPNDPDWEVQEVDIERFSQIENACWHCERLLKPKPPRKPPRRKLRLARHEAELAKLKRWNEGWRGHFTRDTELGGPTGAAKFTAAIFSLPDL